MKSTCMSAPTREKLAIALLPILALAVMILLLAGCGATAPPPPPHPPPPSPPTSDPKATGSAPPTDPPASSSSSSNPEQSTPTEQASAPLIPADGTLKTAIQRLVDAEGMRFSLVYTSTMG